MGDGALGSDHVNYLVFRYLQEAGHENAARALYTDWNRPSEYRDPEALPFAPVIKQNELVNIIQDGVFYDQIHASATKSKRRFRFIEARQSRPSSSQQPSSEARAQSSGRRMSIYAQTTDREDFPTPAPKRPRRSIASDVYLNGDAMEIDKMDKTANEDADSTSGIGEGERTQSEPEPNPGDDEPPIELTSAGTQTEKDSKTRTSTTYWTVDDNASTAILHSIWSPHLATSSHLLTAGDALCRLYNVPTSMNDGDNITHFSPLSLPPGSVISAACWHPSGRYVTCALETPNEDQRVPSHNMFDCSINGSKRFYDLPSYLLQPPGLALAIQYNPAGDLMFSISTNGKGSMLNIWPSSNGSEPLTSGCDPVASKLFDNVLLDAAWTSDNSIVLCGRSLLQFYTVEDGAPRVNGHLPTTIGYRNLRLDHTYPTTNDWDKVRYDSSHRLVAAISTTETSTVLLTRQDESWVAGPDLPSDGATKKNATAVAFQPITNVSAPQDSPRRLAVAYGSGDVIIYSVNQTSCEVSSALNMGPQEPALALAWSSNGTQLATASDESIKVWNIDGDATPKLSWQAAPAQWYQGNDNNLPGDEDAQAEPSLSWDVEGKRIALAVGRKIAIVTLLSGPQDIAMADAQADAEK